VKRHGHLTPSGAPWRSRRATRTPRPRPAPARRQGWLRSRRGPCCSPEAGRSSGRHPQGPARGRRRAPRARLHPDARARVPVRGAPAADDQQLSDTAREALPLCHGAEGCRSRRPVATA
jgi:hypothetical protein